MKVLHIATYDTGGAGIAALRLHTALLNSGVDSKFLCMYSRAKNVPQHFVEPVAAAPLLYRVLNRIGWPVTENQKYWKRINRLKGNYEMATLPFHDLDMSDHPLVLEADVIHLHFISFFIDFPSFFRMVQKPIVWTMHDMFGFLGCFHYRSDSEANKAVFGKLESELIQVKKKAYQSHSRLKIVSPSAWMMREAMASEAMKGLEHHHLHNCIDTDLFCLRDKAVLKEKYGLPADRKILLFVSEKLENKRKGFDLLLEALKNIPGQQAHLLSVGQSSAAIADIPHHTAMGAIRDPGTMAELYAAADAFILPSREDNLPNTMLESLSCGTPVISFRTGGMADEIESGFNGLLATPEDPLSLASAIERFLGGEDDFDRNRIRSRALQSYSMPAQAEKHLKLYASFDSPND